MAKTFLNKKNNAKSTLAAGITNVATSLSVQAGDGAKFPAAPFNATLYVSDPATGEIVKVTAKTTDTFTITRAQEGTTAQAFNAGDKVELLVTAKLFDDFQTRTEIVVATDGSGDYNTDGTSDQTEINEAISNLPAGGGIVHLKKGTYMIDGIVSILKSNVILEGEGPNTIIKIASASNLGDGVRVGDGGTTAFSNIIIKNLMIDGNVAGNTTGNQSPLVIFGASATKHSKILIEGVWLTGARLDCLKLIGVEDSIVKNCFIYSNTGAGLGLFTSSTHIAITGNFFKSNTYGVFDSAGNYNAITGNIFRSNTNGVYLSAGWRSEISGNVFEANSVNGIILTGGARRHAISGNYFYNNGRGVYLDSATSQWNTITGNSFSWSTTDNHIRIVLATDNAIVGNTFHAAWTNCIELQGAQFTAIIGNTIFDSGRAANNTHSDILLTLSGATYAKNNVILGNIIRATGTASVNKTAYCIKENDENIDENYIRNNNVSGAVTQNILTLGRLTVDRDNVGQKKLHLDNAFLETAYWSADIFNSGAPTIVGALLRNFDNLTIRSANTATSNTDVTGWGDASDPSNKMDFGKRPRFKFRAKIRQTLAQEIFLVMGDLGTLFQKYAGFKIVNGVLNAENSNGTLVTTTDISVGITLTNWNEYEVVVLSGKVLFYVNGTLKATHTTNVPAGLDDLAYIEFSVTSNDAAAKFVDIKDMYFEIYA